MQWLTLSIAIIAEVVGTSALRASEGFTKTVPSIIVVIGYGCAFYFLSQSLKTIPVGLAYAIWSGIGTVLITLIGLLVYHQRLDVPAVIGLTLILLGVIIINVFSGSVSGG